MHSEETVKEDECVERENVPSYNGTAEEAIKGKCAYTLCYFSGIVHLVGAAVSRGEKGLMMRRVAVMCRHTVAGLCPLMGKLLAQQDSTCIDFNGDRFWFTAACTGRVTVVLCDCPCWESYFGDETGSNYRSTCLKSQSWDYFNDFITESGRVPFHQIHKC